MSFSIQDTHSISRQTYKYEIRKDHSIARYSLNEFQHNCGLASLANWFARIGNSRCYQCHKLVSKRCIYQWRWSYIELYRKIQQILNISLSWLDNKSDSKDYQHHSCWRPNLLNCCQLLSRQLEWLPLQDLLLQCRCLQPQDCHDCQGIHLPRWSKPCWCWSSSLWWCDKKTYLYS